MKKLILILLVLSLPFVSAAQAEGVQNADRIIFPHDVHFENEVACTDCHQGVTSSTMASDHLLPGMETCADCHDVDADDECGTCHTNVDEAGEYERRVYGAPLFAHVAHLEKEIACAACHGEPASAHPMMPGKIDCRTCHLTAENLGDCRMCHTAGFELRPADHGPGWQNGHGLLARTDQNACFQCHTQTSCQECHAGDNVRPRSHELNYAFNHGLDARGNEMQCITCHQEPTYCSNCHIAERVLPMDHSRSGWVSANGGGQHATEGLFDLESCVACHDAGAEEPSCTRCHSGG
jgi:hypothetical protein